MSRRSRIGVFAIIATTLAVAAVAVGGSGPLGGSSMSVQSASREDAWTSARFEEEQREVEEVGNLRNGFLPGEEADVSGTVGRRVVSPEGDEGDGPSQLLAHRAATPQPYSPITYIPGKTWNGEVLFPGRQNDWEPDVAADPSSPWVYVVTTRFGPDNAACSGCPIPSLVVSASPDNGVTWNTPTYMCRCKNMGWQYDPQLEVATDGTVYGLILSKWHEYLVKSTDHGATWSAPVDTTAGLSTLGYNWSDHGFLTISPDGKDVYVAFNHADSFVVASHDYGATWGTPVQTSPPADHGKRYYYHYKGAVTAGGIVNISAISVSNSPYARHSVIYYDLRSADGGATWTQTILGRYKEHPDCPKDRCRHDHLAGLSNLAADASGDLISVFAGSTVKADGQAIYSSTSTDGGITWSAPKLMSPEAVGSRRVIAAFPAIQGGVAGDFRLAWMDTRSGASTWNVWYTQTSDGGATWTPDVRISDAATGAGYLNAAGFRSDYGDYMGIDIMSNGKTIATFGEAYSYWGPGGTWINIQP